MRRTRMRHVVVGTVGVLGLGVPLVGALPSASATAVLPATVTTLEASPTSTTYGDNITFTINTHAASGPGSPAANVQLKDGGAVVASIPLVGGVAVYNTTKTMVGLHSFTAVFGGGTRYSGSTSAAVDVTVAGAGTTTTINSPQLPVEGTGFLNGKTALTFSATVTGDAPIGGYPKGATVDFYDRNDTEFGEGGTSAIILKKLGTRTLVNGSASITTSELEAGLHEVYAQFNGGAIYSGSTSSNKRFFLDRNEVQITVGTDVPEDSDFIHTAVWGQTVTLTADLVANGIPITPGQPIQFWGNSDGSLTFLGTAPIVDGHAELTRTGIPVGYYDVNACLAPGTYVIDTCSETIPFGVQPSESTTTLTLSPADSSPVGAPVTFTVQVDAVAPGTGHPVSTVTITDGRVPLATLPVGPGGTTTFVTSSLGAGGHTFFAQFNGGTNFSPSNSGPVPYLVGVPD